MVVSWGRSIHCGTLVRNKAFDSSIKSWIVNPKNIRKLFVQPVEKGIGKASEESDASQLLRDFFSGRHRLDRELVVDTIWNEKHIYITKLQEKKHINILNHININTLMSKKTCLKIANQKLRPALFRSFSPIFKASTTGTTLRGAARRGTSGTLCQWPWRYHQEICQQNVAIWGSDFVDWQKK